MISRSEITVAKRPTSDFITVSAVGTGGTELVDHENKTYHCISIYSWQRSGSQFVLGCATTSRATPIISSSRRGIRTTVPTNGWDTGKWITMGIHKQKLTHHLNRWCSNRHQLRTYGVFILRVTIPAVVSTNYNITHAILDFVKQVSDIKVQSKTNAKIELNVWNFDLTLRNNSNTRVQHWS
jgi:hypothetical protein